MSNCPNCGAPIKSHQCEYCGTVFADPDKHAKIEHLRSEIVALQEKCIVTQLYYEALNAMRNYSKF